MNLPESDPAPSAATRVMAIPELATAVLQASAQSDLANISQASRSMFDIAITLLWKNTTAGALLELLEYEDVHEGILSGKSYTVDEFLAYALNGSFERFDIYAPHVEVLEIYEEDLDWCWCHESDWRALRREANLRGDRLLPKLKSMNFMENSSSMHGIIELEWIAAFATPNLEEVSLVPDVSLSEPTIPYSLASMLLRELTLRSPNIHTLALAADDEMYSSSNRFALQAIHKYRVAEPWYHQLEQLQNLRSLTVSAGWLYPPSLGTISQLPNLTSLCIVPGTYEDFDPEFDIDPELSEDTFPRLVRLSIYHLQAFSIGKILTVKAMLREITTLELEFGVDDLDYSYDELDAAVGILFKGLQNLPCLQTLSIDVHPSSEAEWPVDISRNLPYMDEHTSLEFVSLRGMRIDARRHFINPPMTSMWQNVQTLLMPSQPGSIDELALFATMPKLRRLLVDLDLESPHLPEKPSPDYSQKILLESSSEVRLSDNFEDLILLARSLRHLWPKIQRIQWPEGSGLIQMALAWYFNQRILRLKKAYLFGKPGKRSNHRPKVLERVKTNFNNFYGTLKSLERLLLA